MASGELNFFRQKQHATLNMIHTWLLVGGSLFLLALCAYVFFGSSGIIYGAVFGAISLFMALRVSPAAVLKMYKAQTVTPAQFPAGHQILDQLVERAGLSHRPSLNIIPSEMMNAFAVGRKGDSAIAMTDALVRTMTKRELAGIMAHEITHIKNEDIKVMAIADMVSRFTSMMSTFGTLALFANLPSILFGAGVAVPWLIIILLMSAPTVGGLLQLALSRTREYDADLGAAMLTGDPDGLASALLKLEKIQTGNRARNWEGMVLPGGRIPAPSMLRTHPKTEDRIERLMALKEQTEPVEDIAITRSQPENTAPNGSREELPKRSSSVPNIPRRWGRGEDTKYAQYASLLSASTPEKIHDLEDGECLASENSLNAPKGKPKIRLTRGGVWW